MKKITWFLMLTGVNTAIGCGGLPRIKADGSTGGQTSQQQYEYTGGQGYIIPDAGAGGNGGAEPCSGTSCQTGPVCGNSVIEEGESCDDGNPVPGDGCSGLCRIDPNYTCSTPGQLCTLNVVCGDGRIAGSEACDDNNTKSGDGCTADCTAVEANFACPTPGQACVPSTTPAVCGNAIVESGETCDDRNTTPSDGCSSACQLEPGYTCPTPGAKCVLIQYCGDGVLNGTEQCDDGNLKPGDCCDGNCRLEPNCTCLTPTPALVPPKQVCTSSMVCGDGERNGTEACDDQNTTAGDGCSADCTAVEPGYSCPATGGTCTKVPTAACGNAILEVGEYCDDGNTSPSDGCSPACSVETGYVCPAAGKLCSPIARCGDGNIDYQRSETCDDGGRAPGDGCGENCTVELGWSCAPVATGSNTYMSVCTNTTTCGDKKITGAETCEDGNTADNDGCSSTCQLESGWVCPVVGAACRAARCGDNVLAGWEECEDGGIEPNDGCSPTCKVEPGWVCEPGQACRKTVCGDLKIEGSEQCDDGNVIPYDGCSPSCTLDLKCANGACTAVCGDGFKFDQEECDDGNKRSGDGCSADCKKEDGWNCPVTMQDPPATLQVPILFRDFMYWTTPATDAHPVGHEDFENTLYVGGGTCPAGLVTGLVGAQLADDGKPVFESSAGSSTCRNSITSSETFYTWYHDDPVNAVVPSTLTLARQGTTTTYRFDSGSGYFPLNGKGWQTPAACAPCQEANPPTWCRQCPSNPRTANNGNNYSFTSELRYPFTYRGGEFLEFSGDDDVWVFVNGILAVDIGGIHGSITRSITLDATQASRFNLIEGGMYEIAVFQAERHIVESNYKLTLGGFTHATSTCTNECGDGIVVAGEACDLGKDKNTGAYGACNPDCTLAAYCGDQLTQSPEEECDDGNNTTLYDKSKKACGPGCKLPHYCGDTAIDTAYGELCDNGANNVTEGYGPGLCTTECQPAPHCGDGTRNGPEECDDGLNNGTPASLCDTTCRLKCGNGVIDVGEQCDLGASKNVGGYGGCNANCTDGPYCGDGFRQGAEQCDDGKNDGSYGTCSKGCVLAGYCGDGTLQNPPESCDQGASNSSLAYGSGLCTNQCRPAPYCGDKSVDSQFGEKCDDGLNTGLPGSCKPDCSGWVPLNTCGNGQLDAGEQCDEGKENGTVLSACDANCRHKCGNGFVEPGEQCDDGVNDGSYGGCTPTCEYAGYCGDGKVSGPEQCDLGTDNEVSPYGVGRCTKGCQLAPYCGDGRVQSPPEACDGQTTCTAACQWWVPHYT